MGPCVKREWMNGHGNHFLFQSQIDKDAFAVNCER